jgi:y4mF family transcriptional regulator
MFEKGNKLSQQVKALRRQYQLTQEDLAFKSGVGLRFVRELEQGKATLRMDKVNQVLSLFDLELGVIGIAKHGIDETIG